MAALTGSAAPLTASLAPGLPYTLPYYLDTLIVGVHRNRGVTGATAITATPTATIVHNHRTDTGTAVTAAPVAGVWWGATALSSLMVIATPSLSSTRNATVDAPHVISVALVSFSYVQERAEADMAVTATLAGETLRNTNAGATLAITAYCGLPYTLPWLLDTLTAALTHNHAASTEVTVSTTIDASLRGNLTTGTAISVIALSDAVSNYITGLDAIPLPALASTPADIADLVPPNLFPFYL